MGQLVHLLLSPIWWLTLTVWFLAEILSSLRSWHDVMWRERMTWEKNRKILFLCFWKSCQKNTIGWLNVNPKNAASIWSKKLATFCAFYWPLFIVVLLHGCKIKARVNWADSYVGVLGPIPLNVFLWKLQICNLQSHFHCAIQTP